MKSGAFNCFVGIAYAVIGEKTASVLPGSIAHVPDNGYFGTMDFSTGAFVPYLAHDVAP